MRISARAKLESLSQSKHSTAVNGKLMLFCMLGI